MPRSLVTIDLAAIRENARTLASMQRPSELWAVVKADGYGHGATDVGRAALEGGATALCVATVGEALSLRDALPTARILVLGPTEPEDVSAAREARLELAVSEEDVPEDVPVHLKLDTGMGRWGLGELPAPGRSVVGLMTHLATADSDRSFAELQLELFASSERFVSVLGGSSYLASYFGGTNVVYARRGWEVACGAYERWFHRFSGARVVAASNPRELLRTVERELCG